MILIYYSDIVLLLQTDGCSSPTAPNRSRNRIMYNMDLGTHYIYTL